MNDRIVIGPDESLISALVDRLEDHGTDYSDTVIVFPGRRPAHFLRKELVGRKCCSIIPPDIFSIDDFLESLCQMLYPEPMIDLDPIDGVALLYEIHKKLNERLGGNHFNALDSFIPVGLKLFAELEELRLAMLPEKRLKEVLSSLTYNRLFSLARYYFDFYKTVADKKLSTRAVRYSAVAGRIDDISLEKYSRIFIAGLFKLTRAEQTIFNELGRRSNINFIYQTDKPGREIRKPEVHFIKAPDTHGQVFALSALMKERMENGRKPDEKSVIVMPSSDALFPLVQQTLSLIPRQDYNIALGYPVSRTPVYGFLYNLMDLVSTKQDGRYSTASYLKFILHPYTKNIRFDRRTDVTRILFHAIESMLIDDRSKAMITLEEIEEADEVFSNIAFFASEPGAEITANHLKEHLRKIHSETIRSIEQSGSLKEFARKNIQILSYIYEQSTARLHPLFRPYAEAIIQIFMRLEKSVIGAESFPAMKNYLNFLQRYVSMQNVPFAGTPLRGLQVLGLLETRGLTFDEVYLLNANDDVLPGRSEGDMLLPQKLRENLGLETRHDRDALSEHYFNLLLNGAKRIYIFFEESGEREKSRFVERLLWERQKQDKTFRSDPYIETVQYKVKLAGDAVQPIAKSDKLLKIINGFTYSASSLDTYIRCPIQFYYKDILRLEEKEEAGLDPDRKDIGLFVHEVLKNFYEPFKDKKLELADLDSGRMGKIVDELFAQKFGAEPHGAAFLLKRQVRRRLQTMLADYQTKVLESNRVTLKSLEEKIKVHILGVSFQGRIDRAERRDENTVIIDYKTGARPDAEPINFKKLDPDQRDTWNDAVTSFQLPVYLSLYSAKTGISPELISPAYLYLGENRMSKESEVHFEREGSVRLERFRITERLIQKLIEEIQDPEIPFLPPAEPDKTCPGCPFTTFCGTQWIRGWRD